MPLSRDEGSRVHDERRFRQIHGSPAFLTAVPNQQRARLVPRLYDNKVSYTSTPRSLHSGIQRSVFRKWVSAFKKVNMGVMWKTASLFCGNNNKNFSIISPLENVEWESNLSIIHFPYGAHQLEYLVICVAQKVRARGHPAGRAPLPKCSALPVTLRWAEETTSKTHSRVSLDVNSFACGFCRCFVGTFTFARGDEQSAGALHLAGGAVAEIGRGAGALYDITQGWF